MNYFRARKIGDESERRFVEACKEKGWECTKSTDKVDMYDHIDWWIVKEGRKFGVDVKGGNHPGSIWVEFKNVRGNSGWMYGKADLIAFDMPELGGFCLVKREDLLEYSLNNVNMFYRPKAEATRYLYQREGRNDVISRLELSDLLKVKSYKVLKYAGSQS
jgi:hypothetical protein